MQLWLAVWMHIIFTALVLGLVGWNRAGSASRGLQRCEDPVSGAGGVQLWVSRPLIEAKVVARPTFLPPRSYHTTQSARRGSFCFDFNPVHKMTTLRRRLWQMASGTPTLPIQWMTSWRFWWRTEVSAKVSIILIEDEMVSVDKDDEAVNVYYMRNQIDESQKLA